MTELHAVNISPRTGPAQRQLFRKAEGDYVAGHDPDKIPAEAFDEFMAGHGYTVEKDFDATPQLAQPGRPSGAGT